MGRTRKTEVLKRRTAVRKLYLKGITRVEDLLAHSDLQTFGPVSESTIRKDLAAINRWYVAAVEKNPQILDKQAEYILKHLDQLNMIKARLNEIAERAKESGSLKSEISALKAILDELNHEAKVLKLIDVSKTINQYIKIDKIEMIFTKVIDVIKEFVPVDQQKYALERLKQVGTQITDVKSNDGQK